MAVAFFVGTSKVVGYSNKDVPFFCIKLHPKSGCILYKRKAQSREWEDRRWSTPITLRLDCDARAFGLLAAAGPALVRDAVRADEITVYDH